MAKGLEVDVGRRLAQVYNRFGVDQAKTEKGGCFRLPALLLRALCRAFCYVPPSRALELLSECPLVAPRPLLLFDGAHLILNDRGLRPEARLGGQAGEAPS